MRIEGRWVGMAEAIADLRRKQQTLPAAWVGGARAKAAAVAAAAREDARSSRIAASVRVADKPGGAEVVIGEGVEFARAHASKARQARYGRTSFLTRPGRIAYSRLRPKRER